MLQKYMFTLPRQPYHVTASDDTLQELTVTSLRIFALTHTSDFFLLVVFFQFHGKRILAVASIRCQLLVAIKMSSAMYQTALNNATSQSAGIS